MFGDPYVSACHECGAQVHVSDTEKHQQFHFSINEVRDAVWKAGLLND